MDTSKKTFRCLSGCSKIIHRNSLILLKKFQDIKRLQVHVNKWYTTQFESFNGQILSQKEYGASIAEWIKETILSINGSYRNIYHYESELLNMVNTFHDLSVCGFEPHLVSVVKEMNDGNENLHNLIRSFYEQYYKFEKLASHDAYLRFSC